VSIRRRGPKAWQVRVSPFAAKTFPTRAAAEKYELELLLRRSQGDRYVEKPTTLGEEIEQWLARRRARGGIRPATVRFYEQSARVWREELPDVRISALRRAPIEDFIARRASQHPRAAKNELEFFKRVLRDARSRGQRVDEGVLTVEPIPHAPREGTALTVDQLYELASWTAEHSKRLVLLAGMVGQRQRVWFEMTDDLLNLRQGTLAIPARLAKNGKPHRIYLTPIESGLFREQLMARVAGTALVFPTPNGRQWTESGFRQRVWKKAVEAARRATKGEGGGRSPYEGFTFHMLRHTAGSLMAHAGMDPAVAAERLGHSDGGALFLQTYRHLYEAEKRTQALRLDALIRAHLDEGWTGGEAHALSSVNEAAEAHGRGWDRTSDPSRVKRVLSR
jgi:integrase